MERKRHLESEASSGTAKQSLCEYTEFGQMLDYSSASLGVQNTVLDQNSESERCGCSSSQWSVEDEMLRC